MNEPAPLRCLPDGRTVFHSSVGGKHLQNEIWWLLSCQGEGPAVVRQRFRARQGLRGSDEVFEKLFTLDQVFARGGPWRSGCRERLTSSKPTGA